ncbi:hypothetical protein NMY22_g3636 [Coprinellus aureogranulatus]|nr:hypothetical protein NMY22_g3636 [Coprinellus aureogranulatus]
MHTGNIACPLTKGRPQHSRAAMGMSILVHRPYPDVPSDPFRSPSSSWAGVGVVPRRMYGHCRFVEVSAAPRNCSRERQRRTRRNVQRNVDQTYKRTRAIDLRKGSRSPGQTTRVPPPDLGRPACLNESSLRFPRASTRNLLATSPEVASHVVPTRAPDPPQAGSGTARFTVPNRTFSKLWKNCPGVEGLLSAEDFIRALWTGNTTTITSKMLRSDPKSRGTRPGYQASGEQKCAHSKVMDEYDATDDLHTLQRSCVILRKRKGRRQKCPSVYAHNDWHNVEGGEETNVSKRQRRDSLRAGKEKLDFCDDEVEVLESEDLGPVEDPHRE